MAFRLDNKKRTKKIKIPYVSVKNPDTGIVVTYRTVGGRDYHFTGTEVKPVFNLDDFIDFATGNDADRFNVFIMKGAMTDKTYPKVHKELKKTLDWARANKIPESKK